MKLRDLVQRILIDPRKVLNYALSSESERGKHKAKVFERRLGFNRSNYARLIAQIETAALETEAQVIDENEFGQHVRVDIRIIGVSAQTEMVRTGWIIEPDNDAARLVTVFIKER